jgi:hypothetical protein
MNIGGETYIGRPADTGISFAPGADGALGQAAPGPKVFGEGTIPGADGSSWTPLRQPGAAVSALREAGRYRPDAQGEMDRSARDASAAEDTRRRREFEDEDRRRAAQPGHPERTIPPPPAQPPVFPRIPPPGMEDTSSAENTAFGRAHGRIGQLARGSLMATRDEFNGRGLAGSRSEGRAVQGVISDAANQNADVIAQQAAENLHRQQQINDRNYSGEIGQRGADMGYATTIRGQDIGAAESRAAAQSRLDALRRAALGGRY